MTKSLVRRRRNGKGAISAEYAATTAVGVTIVTLLIRFLNTSWGQSLLGSLFNHFLSGFGIHL